MTPQAISQSLIVARIGVMRFKNTKEVVATIAGFTTSLHHVSHIGVRDDESANV
jgi:hypothetical protein